MSILKKVEDRNSFQQCNVLRNKGVIRLCRSSPEEFCKKGAPKNLAKLTKKHLCQNLFFKKVVGFSSVILLKTSFRRRCFFYEFCEIFKNNFLENSFFELFLKEWAILIENKQMVLVWDSAALWIQKLLKRK